jgi:DNA-binding NarL/FixJ family response regulator
MRIVVCDDHRLLLEALAHALATQGFTIEAATLHPAEAVAAVKLYDPDVLLIDLSFPDGNGLDAAREVIAQHPRTRVVVLTGSDDAAAALEAAWAADETEPSTDVRARRLRALAAAVLGKGFPVLPRFSAEADDLDAALDDLLDTRNRMTRRALGLEGSPHDRAGDPS